MHAGQIGLEYFIRWIDGKLVCCALVAGLGAAKPRFHSDWGRRDLEKVIEVFGKPPEWIVRDDDSPRRNTSWKAPTLHLFTHALDHDPPVTRGDNGDGIATFLLPMTGQQKQDITHWKAEYIEHDRIFLGSGPLEIAAYRELADVNSRLSKNGRQLCGQIEQATKIPTFYFLLRYYAHSDGEENRPCPKCGKPWRTSEPTGAPFYKFRFRCTPCRLVSEEGDDLNNRLAKIGEYKGARIKGASDRELT